MRTTTIEMTMEINEFAEKIAADLNRETESNRFSVTTTVKQNETLTSVLARIPEKNIAATLHLDEIYRGYHDCELTYEKALDIVREQVNHASIWIPDYAMDIASEAGSYENVSTRLTVCVCDPVMNGEFLKNVPHEDAAGLALYCRVMYNSRKSDAIGSIVVNDSLLEKWGVSTEKLFRDARRNDAGRGVSLMSITDIIDRMGPFAFLSDTEPKNLLEEEDPVIDEETLPLYVLTNSEKMLGAALIFDPDIRRKVMDIFKKDCFVLPSSIHEVLIMPCDVSGPNLENLLTMVREVNSTQVDPRDRLSDSVLICNAETAELTMKR